MKGGHGCVLCEEGTPEETIWSPAGRIEVCGGCLVRGHPGTTFEWWEARHRKFGDHLGDQLDRDLNAQAVRRMGCCAFS